MSEKINALLKKHFENNRVVFWYDPNGEMQDVFEAFSDESVRKIQLDNDELAVKYRILRLEPEQKFLVYAPRPRPEPENNWLLDLEQGNYVFSTDPPAIIAQELGISIALKPVIQERMSFFRSRQERLEPLASLAVPTWNETDLLDAMLSIACARTKKERTMLLPLDTMIVSLCAGSDSTERWRKIVEWKLDTHFFRRVEAGYLIHLEAPEPRGILLQLFSKALAYQAGENRNRTNRYAFIFIDTWRDKNSEIELFRETALAMKQELNAHDRFASFSDDTLSAIDIVPGIDSELLRRCSSALAEQNVDIAHIKELVSKRQTTYWYLNDAEGFLRNCYDAISTACSLIMEIAGLKKGSQFRALSKKDLWDAYVSRLHSIDRLYRIFNRHYRKAGSPAMLASAVQRISAVYLNDFLKPLSERWQSLLDSDSSLDVAPSQDQFFEHNLVRPLQEGRRLFVLISDGLRWEIGAELAERFEASGKFDVEIRPLRALVPTVTSHGMSALLPHTALERDPEKNEVRIDGQLVGGIESRSKHLAKAVAAVKEGLGSCAMTLGDFISLSPESLESRLEGINLIYLYSSKIDTEGHSFEDGLPEAVEQELAQLMMVANRIYKLGGGRILITADHGFLYSGEARDEEFMLEVSDLAGETWRDQRYILGRGLEPHPGLMPVTAPEPGIPADTSVLVAKGLMKIRRKGASGNFIHGGMTLQELCVPLIQLKPLKKDISRRVAVSVLASRDISTPSLAIKLYQEEPVGGAVLPHRIRMWFESADGIIISNKAECRCDSTDPEEVNRAFVVTFEFLPSARACKGQQVYLKLYTIAEGDTLIPFSTEEFRLKQMAYDIDVF